MSLNEDGLTIVLDLKSRDFLAGDPVAGRLIVNSTNGVKTNGISITLYGEIRVSFSKTHREYIGEHRSTFSHGDGRRNRSYTYSDDETVINFSENMLVGTHELPPGNRIFPFSFHLPHGIPSSMECSHGRVEYSLTARLERSWAVDWTHEMGILVRGLLDLQPYPALHEPVECFTEENFGCLCCTSRPLKLWCNLEQTGFFPGELINFRVKIDNGSNKEVLAVRAVVHKNLTFRAQGHETSDSHRVAEVILQMNLPTTTPASEEGILQGELLVPPCDPSGFGVLLARFHHLINLCYTFDVVAEVSGCCTSNPQVSCDVTIGSLPLEDIETSVPRKVHSSKSKHKKKSRKPSNISI